MDRMIDLSYKEDGGLEASAEKDSYDGSEGVYTYDKAQYTAFLLDGETAMKAAAEAENYGSDRELKFICRPTEKLVEVWWGRTAIRVLIRTELLHFCAGRGLAIRNIFQQKDIHKHTF